jgi:hypothetical protein
MFSFNKQTGEDISLTPEQEVDVAINRAIDRHKFGKLDSAKLIKIAKEVNERKNLGFTEEQLKEIAIRKANNASALSDVINN